MAPKKQIQPTKNLTAQDFLISNLKNLGYIQDEAFELAFRGTQIEKIVSAQYASHFFLDNPVPFYSRGTKYRPISAPSMMCAMLQELDVQEDSKILVMGCGGGFIPTILARMVKKGEVVVIEQNKKALEITRTNLQKLDAPKNIILLQDDPLNEAHSCNSWDRVLITGCIPDVPTHLKNSLSLGGVIISPIGTEINDQIMVRIKRMKGDKFPEEKVGAVRFAELESKSARKIKRRPSQIKESEKREYNKSFRIRSLSKIYDRFKDLIDAESSEKTIQRFLENNPLVLDILSPEIILKQRPILIDYKTDFCILTSRKELVLVEIEKPQTQLLMNNGGLASGARDAIKQVQDWLDEMEDDKPTIIKKIGKEIELDPAQIIDVKGVAIVGRDCGSKQKKLRKHKGRDHGKVKLYTYDDLLNHFGNLIRRLGTI